jgi:hypothetical protein
MQCGEPPHIPLRCEEVEKGNATEARLTIEERMTQVRPSALPQTPPLPPPGETALLCVCFCRQRDRCEHVCVVVKKPRGYPRRHSLRLNARECAAQARLRICSKCKTSLYKEEGCNKVTCRCGTLMCYVCKGKITGYNHFCNHPKNPGEQCRKCNLCSLWSSPEVRSGGTRLPRQNKFVLVMRR